MKSRIEILKDLLKLNGDIYIIQSELAQYKWDNEEPLITLKIDDLKNIFSKFNAGLITSKLIEQWANTIEGRDDIDFEKDVLKEIIYELANPILFGNIDDQKVYELGKVLNKEIK